jgi:hypothetical protein
MTHLELSRIFHLACKNLPNNTVVNIVESGLRFESLDFHALQSISEKFNNASIYMYSKVDNLFTLTIKYNKQ